MVLFKPASRAFFPASRAFFTLAVLAPAAWLPTAARAGDEEPLDARLTLVTCYPFDAVMPGGPLRWVVTAERIGP